MKNRIIYYSLFIFLSIFLLFACQTDLQDVVEKDNFAIEKAFTVEEAKTWFLKNYGDISNARIAGNDERDIDWKKGIKKQIKTAKGVEEVVIFPIKVKSKKDILEDASLWVINGKDGVYSKYLDFYNADHRKMDKKKSRGDYKKDFSGCLNIYDIKNGLEMGHLYENGKITGYVTSFNGEKASFFNKKKGAKTNWCWPQTFCPDVNTQSFSYISSTGVLTISVGRCANVWTCETYFIYNGDPSFDDAYWDYYWWNIELLSNNFVDIISNVTHPCISSQLNNLITNKNLTSKIALVMRGVFNVVGETPFIRIDQGNYGINSIPAQTQRDFPGSYNIILNVDKLGNSSLEYITSVILHESVHISLYEAGFPSGSQHDNMLNNYISELTNALREIFPNLSQSDATLLALNGLSNTNYADAQRVATSKGVNYDDVTSTADKYRRIGEVKLGTPCP